MLEVKQGSRAEVKEYACTAATPHGAVWTADDGEQVLVVTDEDLIKVLRRVKQKKREERT